MYLSHTTRSLVSKNFVRIITKRAKDKGKIRKEENHGYFILKTQTLIKEQFLKTCEQLQTLSRPLGGSTWRRRSHTSAKFLCQKLGNDSTWLILLGFWFSLIARKYNYEIMQTDLIQTRTESYLLTKHDVHKHTHTHMCTHKNS